MTIYHKHHYIPRHAGGTNDPSNIWKVTVEMHALLHLERWILTDSYFDYISWKRLSHQINKEELYEAIWKRPRTKETREKNRIAGKKRIGDKNPFFGLKHTDDYKKISSERMSGSKHPFYGKKRPEHAEKMKVSMKGKKKTEEHKKNISKSHNIIYTCPHCKKQGGRLLKRWHFDHCRFKCD